jgi:hypothetical protein
MNIKTLVALLALTGCAEQSVEKLVAYVYVDDDGSECIVRFGPLEDSGLGEQPYDPEPDAGRIPDAGSDAGLDAGADGAAPAPGPAKPGSLRAAAALTGVWRAEGAATFNADPSGGYIGLASDLALMRSTNADVDCVVSSSRTHLVCTGGTEPTIVCPAEATLVPEDPSFPWTISGSVAPTRAEFVGGVAKCYYATAGAVVTLVASR